MSMHARIRRVLAAEIGRYLEGDRKALDHLPHLRVRLESTLIEIASLIDAGKTRVDEGPAQGDKR